MKNTQEIQQALAILKPELQEKFGVQSIGVFGSYVRGEQHQHSDLDVLVEFTERRRVSLFDFVGLEQYLSDQLGVKVDLVEKSALKPRIGVRILSELVPV